MLTDVQKSKLALYNESVEAVETYVKNGEIAESKIGELADICILEAKGDDCSKYRVSATNLLLWEREALLQSNSFLASRV